MAGSTVKVYSSATSSSPIGTATVSAGNTKAVVSITQLGTGAGTVYVTVTTGSYGESKRTAKNYAAETASPILTPSDITIKNNLTGTADVITVKNVVSGDIIKAYSSSTTTSVLAQTTATSTTATLSVQQLGQLKGLLYFTLTRGGRAESVRISKNYSGEPISPNPTNRVTITNNAGSNDTITIMDLTAGDVVKIYSTKTTTTPMASVTTTKTKETLTVSLGNGGGDQRAACSKATGTPKPTELNQKAQR